MSELAFQDQMDDNWCWGCGKNNKYGLQIKSYWDGDEAICIWKACSEHMAGPKNVVNGGIIATIIDCHSIWTAIASAYKQEKREINTKPIIWYVTASLHVDYLKPTFIEGDITLKATVRKNQGRKSLVSCSLFSEDEECALGEVLGVRVDFDKWSS